MGDRDARQGGGRCVLRDAPLGVFDSGLGGLTVVRALREALPAEQIVYLGDTARVPYGTKGEATVIKYALACARHLVARDVKVLVIACNTVSAVAPDRLRVELDIPVLGVIEPGARAAIAATRNGRVGVLATTGTISSGAYPRAVAQISTRVEVIGQPAPLLVPLAEEGWTEGEVPRLVVRRYVEPLAQAGVDVVVLGCTHYPLLKAVIEDEVRSRIGGQVAVIDSARATAADVGAFLRARGLAREARGGPRPVQLLVTDLPQSFREAAARFLGGHVGDVEQVDL
ncbi:MAG: glutamate racemase [Myxococcota bacterium]|nr:glutamate racemase [Myxococcota bacterium]